MKLKKSLITLLFSGFLVGCSSSPKIQKDYLGFKKTIKPDTVKIYIPDTTKVNPLDTLKGGEAYSKAKELYEEAQRLYSKGEEDSSKNLFNEGTALLSRAGISSREWDFIDPLGIMSNLERYKKLNENSDGSRITITPEDITKVLYAEDGSHIGKKFAKKIAYSEKILETKQKKWFSKTLKKFLQYEPFIDSLLKEYHLPKIFKYPFPIESAMNPKARSKVGAVGIAQWIKSSAILWGQKVETNYDERLDPLKAIPAAVKYFSYLYSFYDDADLAIAAYNWGNGRILRALNQTNSTTYDELLRKGGLPRETQNYLPKIHAFRDLTEKIKMKITKKDTILEKLLTGKFDKIFIHKQTGLKIMAKLLRMNLKDFREYNPAYPMENTPPNRINKNYDYLIRIPKGDGKEFEEKLSKLKRRVEKNYVRRYRIKKGDTLGEVARKFGVRLYNLKRINGFPNPRRLRPGRHLKIPGR